MLNLPTAAPFALFDDNQDASGAWLLTDLVDEIHCTAPADVPVVLARL